MTVIIISTYPEWGWCARSPNCIHACSGRQGWAEQEYYYFLAYKQSLTAHQASWFGHLYSGNVFGHITFEKLFLVLSLDDCYNNSSSAFVSDFNAELESTKWHARLGHIDQERMNRLAKNFF